LFSQSRRLDQLQNIGVRIKKAIIGFRSQELNGRSASSQTSHAQYYRTEIRGDHLREFVKIEKELKNAREREGLFVVFLEFS